MISKWFICTLLFICSTFGIANNVHAFTPKKLPIFKSSDHWLVTIKESEEKSRARKGVYDIYGLSVVNTAAWAYNVHVDVFRDEPNTPTKYGLFRFDNRRVGRNTFQHWGFPISVKANEIKVIITWYNEPVINELNEKTGKWVSHRKYMQEFTFKE